MPGSSSYEARVGVSDLFDVDDGPMLRNRQMVMGVCVVQVSISIVLGLLQAARRRGAILLLLNPFFVAAGVLGYLGAKRCQPVLVMAHFTGSARTQVTHSGPHSLHCRPATGYSKAKRAWRRARELA